MGRVQDQVAVVTGAANGGLGRAIALRLAEEGARLVLGDIECDALEGTVSYIIERGGQACGLVGDVTDEAPAARLVNGAVERYGRLDILINDVGGSRSARIWEMTAEQWDFGVIRLNLRSAFLCTRAAAQHMMKQRSGRIVCLSSGAREGTPWTAYYGASLRQLNETVEYSPNHMTPLRRLGLPGEIANAVLFLASEEASYITGVTLQATGGR